MRSIVSQCYEIKKCKLPPNRNYDHKLRIRVLQLNLLSIIYHLYLLLYLSASIWIEYPHHMSPKGSLQKVKFQKISCSYKKFFAHPLPLCASLDASASLDLNLLLKSSWELLKICLLNLDFSVTFSGTFWDLYKPFLSSFWWLCKPHIWWSFQ